MPTPIISILDHFGIVSDFLHANLFGAFVRFCGRTQSQHRQRSVVIFPNNLKPPSNESALQNRINRWMGDTGANVTRNIQNVGAGPTAARTFQPEGVLEVRRAAWFTPAPPPPPPQEAAVNVKSFGTGGDGMTDDLAAINAALALGCLSGAVYFPAGVYLVSAPLNAIGCSLTVFGDGSSSHLLASAEFLGAGNVVVHDLGLDGQNVHAVGLQLISVTSANIYNVIIRNFGAPGYAAGNQIAEDGLYATDVQNLTVANCVITGNERSGIEMIPAQTRPFPATSSAATATTPGWPNGSILGERRAR